MKQLTFTFLAIVFLLFQVGCEDEANEPIILNSGGGNNGGGNNGGGNGSTECEFTSVSSDFVSCVDATSEDKFEIASWNLKFFPQNSTTTINTVIDIIENMNVDVIALQEIESISSFQQVADNLPDYEAHILDISGSLNIGYLFKTCEISNFTAPKSVLGGEISPRPGVETTITHNNGLEITIINIHLKCCNNGYSRRLDASEDIENYIDLNYPDDNVIVIGDFNDNIGSSSPFSNFINNSSNYRFADQEVAEGSSADWSYPSYPSHIDHILITNELFDNLESSRTIKPEGCVTSYYSNVSDHRPVTAVFTSD